MTNYCDHLRRRTRSSWNEAEAVGMLSLVLEGAKVGIGSPGRVGRIASQVTALRYTSNK